MKRVISILLLVSVLLSCFAYTTAYAADETPPTGVVTGTDGESLYVDFSRFKDVGNHWAKSYLQWAVQNGIMAGTSSTTMTPDGNITRAQMATMITRAFGATKEADISMFVDVEKDAWYADAIAKAVQMGCLSGFGNAMAPNQPVTRQEVAVALVKAAGYVVTDNYNLTKFKDYSTIDSWARPYLSTAVANGLLTGYTNGNLGPKDRVTRAQFVTMLQRVAVAYMTPTATYTSKTVNGSLMVGVGNISLDNMTISQNLFLSDGVGTGSITLDGTQVGNTVYVRGTGPNTVKITNRSNVKNVVFCNPNNAVSLVVDDTSSVRTVTVLEATGSVTLTGNVGDVTVLTGKAPVKFVEADADDVNISCKLAAVSIDKSSVVGDVFISSAAVGADLEISGTAESLDVNGAEATVSVKGTLNNLSFGDTGDSCKLELAKDCVIKNLDIDTDDLTLELSGKLTTVDITGDDCDITFGGSTEITTLNIDGDDNKITFSSGAKVNKVYTTGDNLEITGKGEVKKIQVDGGKSIEITVPNTEVYNKGGSSVYAGEDSVSRGESVTMNSKGTTTVEAEEAEKEEENNKPENPGDGDGNDGGDTKPSTPVKTNISLFPAVDGYPSDFGFESAYSYSTFCKTMSLDQSTGKLTGTVNYIEGFKWYDTPERQPYATGYYVPLVLTADNASSNGILTVGEAEFDYNVVSAGTGYRGRWIAYLYLDPMATNKTIKVTYDPDGERTQYTAGEMTIDYSTVAYSGGNAEKLHYSNVKPMPGVNGAETAVFANDPTSSEEFVYEYKLKTSGLLETRDSEGHYGYWTGLRVPAFNDVSSATVTVKKPSGESTSSELVVVNDTDGARYIDLVADAGTKSEGSGIWEYKLTWRDASGEVSGYKTVTLKVDVTGCVLAGEAATELTPIAGNIEISAVTEDDLSNYGKISDFVFNYKVVDDLIGGTVCKFEGTGALPAGYYIPVKVTIEDAVAAGTLKTDNSATVLGSAVVGETQSFVCMVPVTVVGNTVYDFKFVVAPVAGDKSHSAVSFTVDCSNMSASENAIAVSTTLPDSSTSYITGGECSEFRGTVTIEGTVKKVSSGTSVGLETDDPVWVVPVTVQAKAMSAANDWEISYFTPGGEEVVLSATEFADGVAEIYLVFAEGSSKSPYISLEMKTDTELLTSIAVYFEGTLEGFDGSGGVSPEG